MARGTFSHREHLSRNETIQQAVSVTWMVFKYSSGGKETPALSLVGPPGSRTPQSSWGRWGLRCLNGLVTADKADAWGTGSTPVLQPPAENSHRLPAPDQHVNSVPIKLS